MFIADLHNDVLQRAMVGEDIIIKSENGHSDITRLYESKFDLEVFVIWVTKKYIQSNAYERANSLLNKLEDLEKNCSLIKIIKSLEDLEFCRKNSLLAAPFGIEGGECLENNIENLLYFINKGLLYLGPTWNYSTSLASSAYEEVNNYNNLEHLGLTDFGKEVITICNERNVLIDVAHIGEKSFWDIIKFTKKPIIASHSCVYELCPHYRNLKNDQILAIKNTQGVVFVNMYPSFFDPEFEGKQKILVTSFKKELDLIDLKFTDPEKKWIAKQNFLQKKLQPFAPDLKLYLDHIEYIIKIAGIDYVGIGSDYDGIDCLPRQMSDCRDHILIAKELTKRGYSDIEIQKIMGLNFLRIYKQIKSY